MGAPAHIYYGAPKLSAMHHWFTIVYLYYTLEAEPRPPLPPLPALTDEEHGSEFKSMIISFKKLMEDNDGNNILMQYVYQ